MRRKRKLVMATKPFKFKYPFGLLTVIDLVGERHGLKKLRRTKLR
jgi:hypothetical protein